jgi:hypothetical protein
MVWEVVNRIEQKIKKVTKGEKIIMKELDDLEAQVTANDAVDKSAIELLQGLKALLDAAGTDPVKLKALSDSLGASNQALADAVVANTPAAPPEG